MSMKRWRAECQPAVPMNVVLPAARSLFHVGSVPYTVEAAIICGRLPESNVAPAKTIGALPSAVILWHSESSCENVVGGVSLYCWNAATLYIRPVGTGRQRHRVELLCRSRRAGCATAGTRFTHGWLGKVSQEATPSARLEDRVKLSRAALCIHQGQARYRPGALVSRVWGYDLCRHEVHVDRDVRIGALEVPHPGLPERVVPGGRHQRERRRCCPLACPERRYCGGEP